MKYAVPRGNREFASWPGVAALCDMVVSNRALFKAYHFSVLDLPIADFRERCRKELSTAADVYATDMSLAPSPPLEAPVIATGHQSELHHAGVWLKNHLAYHLGRAAGGTSLNITVDNDTPKHLGLTLPTVEGGFARRAMVPYAAQRPGLALEEYPPRIEDTAAFGSEVKRLANGAPFEEDAIDLANRVAAADGTGKTLADVLTAVRLSYERQYGIANTELPVSRMADTCAFRTFVSSICHDARRFLECHNQALAAYRSANHVRYAANPIPDLTIDGDLVEAPFWVWRAGGPRERLFVRGNGSSRDLFAGRERFATMPVGDCRVSEAAWKEIAARGMKVRPRALSTTLFMRLGVSDLFVHGIGGAKYDEVTDAVIRSFYAVTPPAYAVISATLLVDWPIPPVNEDDERSLARTLRDIKYNPQNLLVGSREEIGALLVEKQQLVTARRPASHDERQSRWQRIRTINETLEARLRLLKNQVEAELEDARKKRASGEALFGREYPCFLVGAQRTVEFYREILAPLIPAARQARPAQK